MVMIPPDVGVRLRIPGDTGLAAPVPIAEIPSDLPDLKPGQAFSARIQEVLPENTYRALVAGKMLTLSLPEGAKAGDTLELVVIDRTPKAIVARQNTLPQPEGGEVYQHTTLSPTAQLIGRLLADQPGQPAIPLNRGAPLLPSPNAMSAASAPTTAQLAAQLAPALANAVSSSGVFYESHQAQWIAGKRPLPSLLQEPQAQFGTVRDSAAQATAATLPMRTMAPILPAADEMAAATARGGESAAAAAPAPTTIPEELRPLVQQQLEAAASQRLLWHGELWPGQPMEWEIEEEKNTARESVEADASWNTTLRLTTPRLGHVEARLRLSGNTLQLTLSTPVGASAADMQDELPRLASALSASGLTLATAQVKHDAGEENAA